MDRRKFLKNTLGGTMALAAARLPGMAFGQSETNPVVNPVTPEKIIAPTTFDASSGFAKVRGVNLGAWLVLESWMVPKLYRGTDAPDEYSLCLALGDKAKGRLEQHRETFITADDFRWIRERGLNAVRLPVGYWALEAPKPYIATAPYIDFALEQCQQNGLKLLLDLHGAPGSQNGWDHSGRSGAINWPKDPQNIAETLRVLDSFAEKYGRHPALFGIELLNEPRDVVPLEILQRFYQDAYVRLRRKVDPKVAIVFHDSFRAFAWEKFMQAPEFDNVILDTHLYQCFSEQDKARNAQEQLAFALNRKETLDRMQREELPTIVGEWSLSLPNKAMNGLSPLQTSSVTRAYADTQLFNYEGTRGWFFWSYKMEHASEWNFRHCVERGWLPDNFTA